MKNRDFDAPSGSSILNFTGIVCWKRHQQRLVETTSDCQGEHFADDEKNSSVSVATDHTTRCGKVARRRVICAMDSI